MDVGEAYAPVDTVRAAAVVVADDFAVAHLRAGDIVVQRGTDHAWANRSEAVTRVCFVLVDDEFDASLLEILPEGAMEKLSLAGLRD